MPSCVDIRERQEVLILNTKVIKRNGKHEESKNE